MALQRIVAATAYPISIAEAKAHLRRTDSDEDALFQGFIAAAVEDLEGPHGRLNGWALMSQTWRATIPSFPACLKLPISPAKSIVQITYIDPDGQSQTLDTAAYRYADEFVDFIGVLPATEIRRDAVSIDFVAGFGAEPSDVPEDLRDAVAALVVHREAHRGDTDATLPNAFHRVVKRYRKRRV